MEAIGRLSVIAQVRAQILRLVGNGEAAGALSAFAVRIAGAGLGYGLHVLLARLLGVSDCGSWATGWTVLLILGHAASLGFCESAVRFLTTYVARGEWSRARGFALTGTLVTLTFGGALELAGFVLVASLGEALPSGLAGPLGLVCVALPFFALQDWLEGVARAFGRPVLARAPVYILRPITIALLMTGAALVSAGLDATIAMAVTAAALGLCALLQAFLVVKAAPWEIRQVRGQTDLRPWFAASAPLAGVFLLDQLAAFADVLALAMTGDPATTGAYFAAARIIALVGMAPYAVSVIAGRGFAHHLARGETQALHELVRRTARWTFWSSLFLVIVLVPAGPLLLAMFGKDFVSAMPAFIILACGLLARAAAGHAEELLVAFGHQRANMRIAMIAAVIAIVFAFIATPLFGPIGAAAAMAGAATVRSFLFVRAARRLTGFHTGLAGDIFPERFPVR